MMAVGCGDGTVRLVNVTSTKVESIYHASHGTEPLPVMAVRWRPPSSKSTTRGILLSAGADGIITQWHSGQREPTFTIKEEDNNIYAVNIRPLIALC
jgi:WD40 repeat protein